MTYDPFDPFNALIEETDPAVLAAGHEWVQQQFYGETMYRDYYIRALPKDWPTLIALGVKLGALSVHKTEDGESVVSATTPGSWDFIGVLYRPTGNIIEAPDEDIPEMTEVTDEEGKVYWHANLRTTVHLGEMAREMAKTDKAVAKAMKSLSKYFLLDDEGNPRAPAQPARGYA
jgi:hypothetical protein